MAPRRGSSYSSGSSSSYWTEKVSLVGDNFEDATEIVSVVFYAIYMVALLALMIAYGIVSKRGEAAQSVLKTLKYGFAVFFTWVLVDPKYILSTMIQGAYGLLVTSPSPSSPLFFRPNPPRLPTSISYSQ